MKFSPFALSFLIVLIVFSVFTSNQTLADTIPVMDTLGQETVQVVDEVIDNGQVSKSETATKSNLLLSSPQIRVST